MPTRSDQSKRERHGLAFLRQNTVALLALFIALTSSAYAITSLPAGSVGTKQLKNEAVTGRKVARGTLTGANIRSATLGTVRNADHATVADRRLVAPALQRQRRRG